MSLNLLSMLQDTLGDTLANEASGFLGESKDGTSKAISAILPSIMGSFVSKGSNESGAGAILDAIKGGGYDGSMLDNLGGLFGGGNKTTGLLNSGSNILNMVLGNKTGGILDMIMRFSGLKRSSSSSLMSMVAPLIINMIGKQVMGKGMGVSGLMDLLKGQKDHVAAGMPAGFNADPSLMGFAKDAFGKVTGTAGNVAGSGIDAGKKVVGGAVDAGSKVVGGGLDAGKKALGGAANMAGGVADTATKTGGSLLKWLIPGLLLLGALSFFGIKTCSPLDKAGDMVKNTTGAVVDGAGDMAKKGAGAVGDVAGGAMDAVSGAFGSINEAGKAALDKVKFGAGSAGSQMMDYIKGGFKGDGKFTFNNLTFASGSANISGATAGEVDNLASILKAYPDVKLNISGYTDNTGNAGKNVTLSEARANAVKTRLTSMGIDASRIATKGYGAADPVATNDTPAGRKQNRRIEASISK